MSEYKHSELNDCHVQINESFEIVYADEEFYSFLGEQGLYTIVRSVDPRDVPRMEIMIEELSAEKEKMVSFRLMNREGAYVWLLADCKLEEELHGHKIISLHLNSIAGLLYGSAQVNSLKNQYEKYLEITGNVLLHYNPENDQLKVYLLSSQEIVFYRGSLDAWKEKKRKFLSVNEKSVSSFEALCLALKNAENVFQYHIKMSLIDDEDVQKWYAFKGRTIKEADGATSVMAVVFRTEEQTADTNVEFEQTMPYEMKDAGTELLNKRTITEYAKRLIALKQNKKLTMAIVDIDNFKTINDTYGHMFGDQVIREVAEAIQDAVGHKGVCGRIGGDEMFILLEDIDTTEEIRGVLRSVRNNISWLYHNDPREIKVTCSIGASTYPVDGEDYDSLFSIADKMLYLAKEKGRNRYIIYHKDLHEDYINGKSTKTKDEASFYKYRKTEVVNHVVNTFQQSEKDEWKHCCQMVALAFELDSIAIYDLKQNKKVVIYGQESEVEGDIQYFFEDNYIPEFREDGLKIVDNINFFERKAPAFFQTFTQLGYNQAVQYLLATSHAGDHDHIVISFNRKEQGKKWANMDASYLAIIGNIIGMSYTKVKKR